ncbi:glycosyl transferase [Rhodocollybia butyracea]|uniref:Anthranilate phosphoribosyltransferase n=1 Tax=Rhodocollybia butyracea TaxID=206335 RepID=A0A9P5UGG1_9AGAR|nr:glycosyl transferase [Rhodocollybia butyracea]
MRSYSNPQAPSFKLVLKKLVDTPEDFSAEDLRLAMHYLFTPDLVLPEHISAFLTALHLHHVETKPELLAAAASVLRERSVEVVVDGGQDDFVVDIVGTGGDGHNLFNVSTAAGIVAAGAGVRVIKHGNKASTSASGSADLLQALGCEFNNEAKTIPRVPFFFLLAPHYHPTLELIAPYRKALPFRTIFNVLGPLISPANPKGMVLGVPRRELGLPFANALKDNGVTRALVVCGQEGIDEISCAGPTWTWELEHGKIPEGFLHPEMFGLEPHPLETVVGGNANANAENLETLLHLEGNIPQSQKPLLDFVLMNAAALLVVAGRARTYTEGVKVAYESIVSGRAWDALETFRRASQR